MKPYWQIRLQEYEKKKRKNDQKWFVKFASRFYRRRCSQKAQVRVIFTAQRKAVAEIVCMQNDKQTSHYSIRPSSSNKVRLFRIENDVVSYHYHRRQTTIDEMKNNFHITMAIIILLLLSNHILYLRTIRVVTDSAQTNNEILFSFRFSFFFFFFIAP